MVVCVRCEHRQKAVMFMDGEVLRTFAVINQVIKLIAAFCCGCRVNQPVPVMDTLAGQITLNACQLSLYHAGSKKTCVSYSGSMWKKACRAMLRKGASLWFADILYYASQGMYLKRAHTHNRKTIIIDKGNY